MKHILYGATLLACSQLVAAPIAPHQPAPFLTEWHYAGYTDIDNVYIKKNSYAYNPEEEARYMILQYRPIAAGGHPAYYTFSVFENSCGASAGSATLTDFEGRKTFLPFYFGDRSLITELATVLCEVPKPQEAFENDLPEH